MFDFYLVDVKSTINNVAFDYINTYRNLHDALEFAEALKNDTKVSSVSVHRWLKKDDGTEDHAEDEFVDGEFISSIPLMFVRGRD